MKTIFTEKEVDMKKKPLKDFVVADSPRCCTDCVFPKSCGAKERSDEAFPLVISCSGCKRKYYWNRELLGNWTIRCSTREDGCQGVIELFFGGNPLAKKV